MIDLQVTLEQFSESQCLLLIVSTNVMFTGLQ